MINTIPSQHTIIVFHLLNGLSPPATAKATGMPEQTCTDTLIWFGKFCRALLNSEMRNLRPMTKEAFLFQVANRRARLLVAHHPATGLVPVFKLGHRRDPLEEVLEFDVAMRSRNAATLKWEQEEEEPQFSGRFADFARGRQICEAKTRQHCTLAVRNLIQEVIASSIQHCRSLDEIRAVMAAHVAHHDYCSLHDSLRTSPAHAAGLASHRLSFEQFFEFARRRLQWEE